MKTNNIMKENLNNHNEVTLSHPSELNAVRLSQHFKLSEFLNLRKYPENIPTIQAVANLTYGCHQLLEPARLIAGPIIINSGFRCESVNRKVGGVRNSQHLIGQAADIRLKNPAQFSELVDFLKKWEYTDQLLTGSGWLHISWNPFSSPRHFVRIGYYK
ncbi:MAG: peptidase M15 [Prevotella sp.]|nr:peptidase M15 [Prevotella sp.]